MTEPTKEHIEAWQREWYLARFVSPTARNVFVARRAAAWAREQALEEAARVCDSVDNYANPMTACDCAYAIRALKAKSAKIEGGDG